MCAVLYKLLISEKQRKNKKKKRAPFALLWGRSGAPPPPPPSSYTPMPLRSWRRILQIQVHVHNDYDDKNFSGGSRLAGIPI